MTNEVESRWSHFAEATYRVFARGHLDTTLQFVEMEESLRLLCEAVVGFPVTEYYLPCAPEQIQTAKNRGLLLVAHDGRECLLVREQIFVLPAASGEEASALVREADMVFGAVFAVLRAVESLFTDVVAV